MAVPPEVMDMLEPARADTRIAIVGASNDRRKYGHIILEDLRRKGFTVLPVNPNERKIGGLDVHPKVRDVPGEVHVVNFVVPPETALEVLGELDPARTPVVWFQPGAYDSAVLRAARARFPTVIAGDCIMVVTR